MQLYEQYVQSVNQKRRSGGKLSGRVRLSAPQRNIWKSSAASRIACLSDQHHRRYSEMRPIDAPVKMLKEVRRPIKRADMKRYRQWWREDRPHREKSISQGIGASLSSGTILGRNGKIGLSDWPEEEFK